MKMNRTIITVDDSPSVRQMVGFTLQRAGYSVVEACDGRDALDKLSQTPAQMVIADLNMPNMDGLDLIRHLRREPNYRYVPIIMLTTENESGKKQAGREAGATGWIVKPFTPEQLVSVVSKVLR
jgi:two-component system, chemotaxis family, chemotaxis protein CheY